MEHINGTYVENNMLRRLYRLKNLHHVIAQVLEHLSEKYLEAFTVLTKIKKRRTAFSTGSYRADIPEHKDRLGLKY